MRRLLQVGRLYTRMLRYRVAVMLPMFICLAAALHGRLETVGWRFSAALIALCSSYVCATTINDIADVEVDRVNHAGSRARPLVTGDATPGELWGVHVVAAILALLAGAFLGIPGLAIVVLSLLINYLYSAAPFRLSHRTYLAPVLLSVAYVLLPFALGLQVVHAPWSPTDWSFGSALFCFFLCRINLKDFRDRDGDGLHGKPTLLLRFGKSLTCAVSLVALGAGNVFLLTAFADASPYVLLLFQVQLGLVYIAGFRLWKSTDRAAEQMAIGTAAKMGNGLLLAVLAWLLVREHGGPVTDQVVAVAMIISLFGLSFWRIARSPQLVLASYRG